jgi:tungstate transport system ATP-binding protein
VAETLLTLREIAVHYGAFTALEIKSLEIQRGEVLAIIGPNGAGKSTLLRVIGLLQRPSAGTILFGAENAVGGNSLHLRRRIATVFQEPLLLNATVYENATLGLRLRGLNGSEIERQITPWLERLGIAELRGQPARILSGGEAQRTSLARALALGPELLLLDEPLAALDAVTRETLLRDFQRIVKETGITTVWVSHDRNEAFSVAARVGVLDEGRLLQLGNRQEVFHRPRSESVARIVGIENRWRGTVEKADADSVIIDVDGTKICARGRFNAGAKVIACLKSDDISLSRSACEKYRSNCLKVRLIELSHGVTFHRTILICNTIQLVASIDRKTVADLGLAEGDELAASFLSASVHVVEVQSP